MDRAASPGNATVHSNLKNHQASVATASVIIGFGIGRTFIFYDPSEKVSENWKRIFDNQPNWKHDQFEDYNKPLGWTAKLLMNQCPNVDSKIIDALETAFLKSFGAELKRKSLETVFFTPGVGVLRFELSFADGQDITSRLNDLSNREKRRETIRPHLEALVEAAANAYTNRLDGEIKRAKDNKQESLIKPFPAVDREKPGHPVFFVVPFVDQPTFDERTRAIRDLLAVTDEQKRILDERARVGYEGASVFVDWSEALVTGNRPEQKQQIETNFIIAMASWCSLSLMEHHSSKDTFDAFAQTVGAKTKLLGANDVDIRAMAYRDISETSLPIRWTANSRDLYLLEAIHRNWSSDRLRRVIGERMQSLSLHHQRIQNEQKELFNARQGRLNQRLTAFALFVTISTLASAAASLITLYHTSGMRNVILSLALPVLVSLIFLIIYLRSRRFHSNDAG